jgi:hypothetical protein
MNGVTDATAQTREPLRPQTLSCTRAVTALEHIRPMRGGSQPHLMRCSDGHYYVVKFANNPQGSRILANELIAGKLAKLLGLPSPETCLVEVREELIDLTPGLAIKLHTRKILVEPGLAFGSQYAFHKNGDGRRLRGLVDVPFRGIAEQVENLQDLLGILMFDKWTCNTDHREVVLLPRWTRMGRRYRIMMIDNGFCFNAITWGFPNSPLHGLYHDRTVYRNIDGIKSFDSWLGQLELKVTNEELMKIAKDVPTQWLRGGAAAVRQMLEWLFGRKKIVPDLIQQALATGKGYSFWIFWRVAGTSPGVPKLCRYTKKRGPDCLN